MRREGPTFELPGEAAAGKGLAAVAGPSPALCQPRTGQRNWGPAPPNSSTTAQLRISVVNMQSPSPASTRKKCGHPAALGASLGVGPAPKAVCQSESATPPLAPFLRGTASPWSIPVCCSSTPCDLSTSVRSSPCVRIRSRNAVVRTRLQGHKVFRAAGKRPFGPLAQTASVITVLLFGIRLRPELALPAADCAVRPHQRRSVVLLFGCQCLFAFTLVPRINVIPRSLF